MNVGKKFENEVKTSIPDDVYYLRIKDPAQSFGGSATTRFSPPNDYDAILYKYPKMVTLEMKTTAGTSIPFNTESNKSSGIKKNQIDGLTKASTFGIISGVLMNFRNTDSTYWLDIGSFNKFTSETTKKSINERDILTYGGREVPTTKKRTRNIYDLSFLWND